MPREHSSACPQEEQHFATCVARLETGEDGRATQCGRERPPIIFEAYESAGTGRKVALPFVPPAGKKPIELWLR